MAAKRPTESNLELGRALRNARIVADFRRQADVAKRIGCSQPTIARIENGTRPPTAAELTALLDLYQSGDRAEIEHLASLVDLGLALNPKFADLLRAEEGAAAIRTLTSERIPMPLQCERYVLKQYDLSDPSIPPKDVLRLHARRVDVLKREQGPTFDAVMSLSSLLRMPGGQADLVTDQTQHLLDLLDSAPRLTVRVLKFDANIPYLDNDFTLVVMRGGHVELAYLPSGRDGAKITDRAKIKERKSYWKLARDAALSTDETRELLRELAEDGPSAVSWRDSRRQSG